MGGWVFFAVFLPFSSLCLKVLSGDFKEND